MTNIATVAMTNADTAGRTPICHCEEGVSPTWQSLFAWQSFFCVAGRLLRPCRARNDKLSPYRARTATCHCEEGVSPTWQSLFAWQYFFYVAGRLLRSCRVITMTGFAPAKIRIAGTICQAGTLSKYPSGTTRTGILQLPSHQAALFRPVFTDCRFYGTINLLKTGNMNHRFAGDCNSSKSNWRKP
jgi:hypothetical protein